MTEREGLMYAIACLMNGHQPDWDEIGISKKTRMKIVEIAKAQRLARQAPQSKQEVRT